MGIPRLVTIAALALLATACHLLGGARDTSPDATTGMPTGTMPPEANRMKPDHAPTPFSADEIRRACPPGRTSTYRVETPGRPTVLQTFAYQGGDATSGAVEVTVRSKDGRLIGKPHRTESRWTKFQSRASFPQASTIITEDDVDTPAGDFDCWLYTVIEDRDGRSSVTQSWFAKDLAGPAVQVIQKVDGRVVSRRLLVELLRRAPR